MNHHVIPAMALTFVLCACGNAGDSPATERAHGGTLFHPGGLSILMGHAGPVVFYSLYGYSAITAGAKPKG
jgi:hypothetical protein